MGKLKQEDAEVIAEAILEALYRTLKDWGIRPGLDNVELDVGKYHLTMKRREPDASM